MIPVVTSQILTPTQQLPLELLTPTGLPVASKEGCLTKCYLPPPKLRRLPRTSTSAPAKAADHSKLGFSQPPLETLVSIGP
jgi:hypothetical protein